MTLLRHAGSYRGVTHAAGVTSPMHQLQGLIGVVALTGVAYLLSAHRSRVPWRLVIVGVLVQFVLAYLLLSNRWVVWLFDQFAAGFNKVISFADDGIVFVFGAKLADPSGPWGFVFAFKVLPIIIFFAALMSVLYYVGIMPRVVAVMAWMLRKTLGVTGTEALSAAANVFLGQTEAPLCVRPYLPTMTRSQLMGVMVPGFSTIAGSVLAAYIGILGGDSDESKVLFAKHLMTASVMSAPGGLALAKLMVPETEPQPPEDLASLRLEQPAENLVDAAALGATDGLKLAANVAAMIIAFVALLALVNLPLAALGDAGPVAAWREANHLGPFSIEAGLAWIFRPVAWLIGVPWHDAGTVGSLIGTQVIATEFIAYMRLQDAIKASAIDPFSAQVATYALCGFANIPSIAIQIGGFSAMAPTRRADIAALATRAMITGLLALWLMAATAGLFIR